jgi:glycosyltransferase involved in cell wall biosynthesis
MGSTPESIPQSSEKIAVALLSDTVGLDAGTERQVIETAKRLDKYRFDVHVVCLEDSPQLREVSSICRTAVFPVSSLNSLQGIRQVVAFRKYAAEYHLQILHGYMNKTSLFAVLSALGTDRIAITSRLNTGYWYTPSLRRMFRVMNLRADGIMANSLEAKRIAVETERLDPDRVKVVYQGVDMTRFSRGLGDPAAADKLGIPRNARVVGIVANLRPVKDHALFLRSAKLVTDQVPDVAFLLAGRGELYDELRKLAGELGIGDRVFFTQGGGNMMDWLSRMSIGCLTSISEGFSNAIMEYMAAGMPVVAIDVGGNRDAVVDSETGYLVPERSPEKFAEPLIKLLRDEELRASMGAKGFERCSQLFEVQKTIGQLEDYYRSLLRRPGH